MVRPHILVDNQLDDIIRVLLNSKIGNWFEGLISTSPLSLSRIQYQGGWVKWNRRHSENRQPRIQTLNFLSFAIYHPDLLLSDLVRDEGIKELHHHLAQVAAQVVKIIPCLPDSE